MMDKDTPHLACPIGRYGRTEFVCVRTSLIFEGMRPYVERGFERTVRTFVRW